MIFKQAAVWSMALSLLLYAFLNCMQCFVCGSILWPSSMMWCYRFCIKVTEFFACHWGGWQCTLLCQQAWATRAINLPGKGLSFSSVKVRQRNFYRPSKHIITEWVDFHRIHTFYQLPLQNPQCHVAKGKVAPTLLSWRFSWGRPSVSSYMGGTMVHRLVVTRQPLDIIFFATHLPPEPAHYPNISTQPCRIPCRPGPHGQQRSWKLALGLSLWLWALRASERAGLQYHTGPTGVSTSTSPTLQPRKSLPSKLHILKDKLARPLSVL
jgi:hypothetical protein